MFLFMVGYVYKINMDYYKKIEQLLKIYIEIKHAMEEETIKKDI